MAVTLIYGGLHTRNIEQTQIQPMVDEEIDLYDADVAPFTHLLRHMKSDPVEGPYYFWYEDERIPEWGAVDGQHAADDTTIQLHAGEADYFPAGSLFIIPSTGEIGRVVSADLDTDIITVETRGSIGTTGASIIANDAEIFKLAMSYAEGASTPASFVTKVVPKGNYTMISRFSVEQTRTASQTKLWTGDERARQRLKKLGDLKTEQEKVAFFSEPSEITPTGQKPIRTSGGIINIIPAANKHNMNAGTLDETAVSAALVGAFTYVPSKTLYMFTSEAVCARFDTIAMGKLQLLPLEDTYGVRINQWVTNRGTLRIINHRLFTGATYGKQAVLVDVDKCWYRPMLDITLKMDIQTKKEDLSLDEWIAEYGFKFTQGKSHSLWYNIVT
jgi:hypothetical protein